MDSTRAGAIASSWVDEHEQRSEAMDASPWLVKELEEVLSDEAVAGAGATKGLPAVVAVDGNRFCWLTLARGPEGEVVTHFGSFPLSGLSIEVDAKLKATGPGLLKIRIWTLTSGARSVSITTKEFQMGSLAPKRDASSGEEVLREAARRAGQPIPSS